MTEIIHQSDAPSVSVASADGVVKLYVKFPIRQKSGVVEMTPDEAMLFAARVKKEAGAAFVSREIDPDQL